jgi:hypothetical protein
LRAVPKTLMSSSSMGTDSPDTEEDQCKDMHRTVAKLSVLKDLLTQVVGREGSGLERCAPWYPTPACTSP